MQPALLARTLRGWIGPILAVLLSLASILIAAPAQAAVGSIDFVDTKDKDLRIVYSLTDIADGAVPDLATVTVTIDGGPVEATAESASESVDKIRRTTILAIDVSNSMRKQGKFAAAKEAANTFLDEVPDDVFVGLVTFASDVTEVQTPTQDTEAVRRAINGLTLTPQTRLYDGIVKATEAAGDDGSRSVLVLSDGRDTSQTPAAAAVNAISASGVRVDLVALAQNKADTALLQTLADAGNGDVLPAGDASALSEVFAEQARSLASQVLITASPPEEKFGTEATVNVTVQVDGEPTTDEAYVSMPAAPVPDGGGEVEEALQPAGSGITVSRGLMFAGLVAAAVAIGFLIFTGIGTGIDSKQDAVDKSIEAYTRKGAKKLAAANASSGDSTSVTKQAVSVAQSMLEGQKGLEAALGSRLEAAGLGLKPAEWLLAHFGIAVGAGIVGVLFSGGSLLPMALGLLFGILGPWFFLGLKRSRRVKAFKAQLADTLQLMAGSLSAGLSLAQSVDTVVREGNDPMAGELRRAIMETRLGVEIEDALSGVADRMHSVDFEWVVMAIRIQREVGGNLAELLNKVAETIREREFLERQVLTLSAEGRLSVWILGGLPPAFMAYLAMSNPTYLSPLFTNPIGWVLLTVMVVLLTVGIFWMKKVVKVEV